MDYCKSILLHESSAAGIGEARTSAANAGGEAALGIYAKFSPTQERRGLEPYSDNTDSHNSAAISWIHGEPGTGEVLPFTRSGTKLQPVKDRIALRLERFALQSAARRLLPDSRTAKCLRHRQHGKNAVEVWRSAAHKSAHYGGLQTCGSVWACPVCAAKISERRRIEVLTAMDKHKTSGGEVLLLTITNRHTVGDDLAALLAAQAQALRRFTGQRSSLRLFQDIGQIGTIRALEVTHGANGFHPHYHILLFVRAGLDLATLRGRFYVEWANACRLAKLPIPSEEHGVSLDDGSKAAEYATKGVWGLDQEMTKGHIKKARKGRSPFDLLRAYFYDDDKQAGALFRIYAQAFKGKQQLKWSDGLKALFLIDERSDEETSAAIEDDAVKLGEIELDEWRLVLRYECRGDVLELARLGGWEPVRRLLDSLTEQHKNTKTTRRRNDV